MLDQSRVGGIVQSCGIPTPARRRARAQSPERRQRRRSDRGPACAKNVRLRALVLDNLPHEKTANVLSTLHSIADAPASHRDFTIPAPPTLSCAPIGLLHAPWSSPTSSTAVSAARGSHMSSGVDVPW